MTPSDDDATGPMSKAPAALDLARELGDRRGAGQARSTLAVVLRQQGELEAARSAFEGALADLRATGERRAVGYALWGLASVRAAQGDLDGAQRGAREALGVLVELGDKAGVARVQLTLASVSQRDGPRKRRRRSRHASHVGLELEARLAEAAIEGDANRLHELTREAATRGFVLLARQAERRGAR